MAASWQGSQDDTLEGDMIVESDGGAVIRLLICRGGVTVDVVNAGDDRLDAEMRTMQRRIRGELCRGLGANVGAAILRRRPRLVVRRLRSERTGGCTG